MRPSSTWPSTASTRSSAARPLQRTIQRRIENELSRMLLEGRIAEGDRVRVEVRDGWVDFDVIRRSEEAPTGSEPSEEAQAAATS